MTGGFIKEVRNKVKQVKFPFHLRVPKWCKQAEIRVNGKMEQTVKGVQAFLTVKYRVSDIALAELEQSFIEQFHVYLPAGTNTLR